MVSVCIRRRVRRLPPDWSMRWSSGEHGSAEPTSQPVTLHTLPINARIAYRLSGRSAEM